MNLTLIQKIKNTDPLMGAKYKSKTHLLNTLFDFFLSINVSKTQNFMLISNAQKKKLKAKQV
jgi:hypothetical protein